ncbi:polysaccharide biosynthesis/export family protein [Carboxylicivirga sp. N1Y90]|uniref:polysaccharide biosynthesis/export family protein n=1 Tax=Carboxylicivirga fragile TaxID=3417571 RepID=UPI003D3539B3|nr:polysaccharide biosynthesis/export family protein [Marinilabiliaceae bacterium N1Y90]
MRLLIFIVSTLLFISCVPQKEIVYLQDDQSTEEIQTFNNEKEKILIKSFDQLYIQVSSFDDGKINFMSNDANRYGGGRSEADLAMVSYTVDSNGFIDLPIIGKFKVSGLNADEAADKIREELQLYLNAPTVKLSFVNKNITVLGYVTNPGRYFYASEHLNILQALGMAGDITIYGNRKYAVIVRVVDNVVSKQRVDLTNVALLGDDAFYLQPNDVVYVEPLKTRKWGIETFPWAIVLSSITTFILVANYISNN